MTLFSCQKCDTQYPKWQGRCNECGQWGTLILADVSGLSKAASGKTKTAAPTGKINLTSTEDLAAAKLARFPMNLGDMNALLGGGMVPGSLILLAGEPGIGKSTLVLQILSAFTEAKDCLYLAGEESPEQIKSRLDRLKLKPAVKFLTQPTMEKAVAAIQQVKPAILIADSIQTIFSEQVDSPTGSLNQIKACTVGLLEACKKSGTCCLIIGQVTKDGQIAGPKSLEHLVDTVLYLEGDQLNDYRILRVTKNRFGPADEILVLKMSESGLNPVSNPSTIFLGETRPAKQEGSVVTAVIDGSKTFLLEIQALVTPTNFGYPQRRSAGFDNNRLQLLLAVLTKRAKLSQLNNQDVHVNVAGGYKIAEPAADLAVCLAVASSLLNKEIEQGVLAFGEVGLGGEIRPVKRTEQRLKEAKKLGFSKIIGPESAKHIMEAIKTLG